MKRKEALIKEGLIEVYRGMGNYEKAFFYTEERLIYEIEEGNVERNEALAKVEAQFLNCDQHGYCCKHQQPS